MRVFKKDATRNVFTVEVRDHNGLPFRTTGFPDQEASGQLGYKLARLVAAVRNGDGPPADLAGWINAMRPKLRDRLVKRGLLSQRRVTLGKPLDQLLADWETAIRARGTEAENAAKSRARAASLFAACGYVGFQEIRAQTVAIKLLEWRERRVKPLSKSTANAYLGAAQDFSKWMRQFNGAPDDPLAGLVKIEIKANERKRRRRPMDIEEQRQLIATTRASTEDYLGVPPADRADLYEAALGTGLRSGELRRLRVGDLAPDSIRVVGKNGEEVWQLIRPHLAQLLLKRCKGMPDDAPILRLPDETSVPRMLTLDLAAAGIVETRPRVFSYLDRHGKPRKRIQQEQVPDSAGRVVDFHALRHAYNMTMLRGKVDPRTTMEMMRHKSSRMTMETYGQLRIRDSRSALNALPDLSGTPKPKRRLRGA